VNPNINYLQKFERAKQCFDKFGFNAKVQACFFRLVSGILRLGNIDFVGQDKVQIASEQEFEIVCDLIGNPTHEILKRSLVQRLFSAGQRSSAVWVPMNYTQAIENRDALAKVCFLWIYGMWRSLGISSMLMLFHSFFVYFY
jgi:myosin heavy subunit